MKTKLFDRPTFKLVISIISGLFGVGFIFTEIERMAWSFDRVKSSFQYLDHKALQGPLVYGGVTVGSFLVIMSCVIFFSRKKVSPLINILALVLFILLLALGILFKFSFQALLATILFLGFSYVMAKDAIRGYKEASRNTKKSLESVE